MFSIFPDTLFGWNQTRRDRQSSQLVSRAAQAPGFFATFAMIGEFTPPGLSETSNNHARPIKPRKGIMMQDNGLDRRDFHKLTAAALGGMIAGTTIGCGGTPAPTNTTKSTTATPATGSDAVALSEAEKLIIDEPHTCRGLNSCKNEGRSKDNACAGQGTCANIADSTCGGTNKCQGQGGCGELPGMNSCKGKGGCHIPLMDEAWTTARTAFEAAMKKSNKTFGAAPKKPKG